MNLLHETTESAFLLGLLLHAVCFVVDSIMSKFSIPRQPVTTG
jgi:hypothetical protein